MFAFLLVGGGGRLMYGMVSEVVPSMDLLLGQWDRTLMTYFIAQNTIHAKVKTLSWRSAIKGTV